jgi:hypothetical protein
MSTFIIRKKNIVTSRSRNDGNKVGGKSGKCSRARDGGKGVICRESSQGQIRRLSAEPPAAGRANYSPITSNFFLAHGANLAY